MNGYEDRLLKPPAAEANPQAGFTRHPVAYTHAGGAADWPAYLGFLANRLAVDIDRLRFGDACGEIADGLSVDADPTGDDELFAVTA